jgi:hypothetical protein
VTCGYTRTFKSTLIVQRIIGHRLKLSGIHWSVDGAIAIATLRCQQASRPEDQICPAPRNQTPAA